MQPVHGFILRRQVEFADTDMAGIMHFANFFRFMEATEHAFYRSLGFSANHFEPEPGLGKIEWPRVYADADFGLPLRFEEEVEIELLVREVRCKTIRFRFHFWKNPDTNDRILAAKGNLSVVCVRIDESTGQMKAIPIPDSVRSRMRVASEDLLDPE